MPHIIILEEAMERLSEVSSTPPSSAQSLLMAACQDADTYAHGENPAPEILEAIEEVATSIKGYLDVAVPPNDIRVESYANQMNAVVPG